MPPDGWVTSSPGGLVHLQVAMKDLAGAAGLAAGPRLYYRVAHGAGDARVEVLAWSPLGVVRSDQDFTTTLTFVGERTTPVREEYTLPRGKRSQYRNQGVERVLSFETATRQRLDLILRVFDDGFAFRYAFPGQSAAPLTMTAETTGFRLPAGTRASMSAYRANYEAPWQADVAAGTPGAWSFPALFRIAGRSRWLLVTEAGLDGSYSATHLAASEQEGFYRIAFPPAEEANGTGASQPSSTLPWLTPWRVGIVGERLSTIVESSLVTDLAPPSRIADTSWIQPGRASWSWWSEPGSPRLYEAQQRFVDGAAALGWEYTLIDARWHEMQGGTWRDLVRHAASRNVGVMLWYHSGVPSTRPAPAAVKMIDAGARRQELERIAVAGVRGVKVDFFDSDKQEVIKLYLAVLEETARQRLMVNFHGATLPRGWERTWPHLLTSEAARGAEHYKFDAVFPQIAPAHNTVLVFTRNVVGPMDYTPVTFSHSKHPRRTTWGHELALSVVFESGLQHFGDGIESYRALPDEVRGFLAAVPAAWDETRLIDGEPGALAVLARRKGRQWFIAGINGEGRERTLTLPMDLLGNGTFDMMLAADGKTGSSFLITRRQRNGLDQQSVRLAPFGGFAMRLAPLE